MKHKTGLRRHSASDIAKDFEAGENVDYLTTSIQRKTQMRNLRIENQTRIFASMCPDEILEYYNNYDIRTYYTTLMLGDISGFTEMTDRFTKSGKGGPSKLSEILNSYIGAMVQEILSHGGDVLKFSGDAFIVMWKVEDKRDMRVIASEAIKTACVIQKHFGTYETEIDITLKVKLAIASGKTYFSSIGSPETGSYYVIIGKPVWEVKHAEALSRGGDILVSASCWQWVNPSEYIHESMPDGIHTLIISLSVLWDIAKDSYSIDVGFDSSDEDFLPSSSSGTDSNLNSEYVKSGDSLRSLGSSFFTSPSQKKSEAADFSLRSKLIKVSKAGLIKELRSYMLRPVIRSVEMDEPLEYLTEIRQVVIVFVNIVIEQINKRTIIKLVKSAFSYVCSVVGEMQGCVNKTSLFDKDLMFLCIFGLRGDKHELESQIGLRCATKLRNGLSKFEKVKYVSVGVTTGLTYCGVVGHVLRREYTVIGMAVNKAARLMCAYINKVLTSMIIKVVCDRESFLLSHLEAKHFILQEAKHLKGITNVGPIYEFLEQASSQENELTVNKYPLLGRGAELKIFYDTLKKMLEYKEAKEKYDVRELTTVLIIKGEPRIGKTRYLEELTNITGANVNVNFISLSEHDKKNPYILLRLIFYLPMNLTEITPLREKREKLSSYVNEKEHWRLCSLNHIFNANFPASQEYLKLSSSQRKKIIKKMLTHLTRSSFLDNWVVIVDDVELADDESMAILYTVLKQKNVFFVLAYGNKLSTEYTIPPKIVNNAQVVHIMGLDKWYHAALACQVMEVAAIPADLEKDIQEKSSGNPGWIQSYLISLLQSSSVRRDQLNKKEIHELGLVVPSANMLKRIPEEALNFDDNIANVNRGWEMYQYSFSDSFVESEDDDENSLMVCTLTSKFNLEDMDTEPTMDSMLLKIYDSLTPLDQLLLKCATVLGDIVDRKILEQLMQGTPPRVIALSVVKLFELHIIGCAFGDFSKSPGPTMSFRSRIHDANLNVEIRCGCKNVEIPEEISDLPYFAACSLMRFKLDMFRETTYRLLTDNQKVEFHNKALRYLQQNIRRCSSCGGGQFNKLLGRQALNEIDRRRSNDLRYDPTRSSIMSSSSNLNLSDELSGSEISSEELHSPKNASRVSSSSSLRLFQLCKPIAKLPTKTFSAVDLTKCECNLILLTAYTHVLEHCRGIGVKELLLVAILEFVEVCISTLNIPQATKLLNEGDELVETIYNSPEHLTIIKPYLKAKIQTFRGRCFLESGLYTEAQTCLEETMRIMHYTFPTNHVMIRIKSFLLLKEQEMMLTCLRKFKVNVMDGDEANYNDQFASCLAHLFVVYRLKGMQYHAKLAAIWGLNTALQSHKDFLVLCTSYANMMITAHNYQCSEIIPYLETDAINLCNQQKESMETQELNAVAELYTRIFFSRWLRGLTESAISIGFIAAKLAHAIRSVNLELIILPRLIQLLTTGCRYGESVPLLQELEFLSQHDMDQSGRTWYYSLCMDLLLESGINIVMLRECEKFYQEESSKIMTLKDSEAAKRFFISMWLWYVRIGDWEAASVWRSRKCDDSISILDEYTVASAITILKKIEGLIICYVFKVDHKNTKDARIILHDIQETFKVIENLRKIVKIIQPRYLLMKAYYEMARNRKVEGLAHLEESKKLANEIGNKMIYNWADHCQKAWTGSLSEIEKDSWKEQCLKGKKVDWHEIDLKDRIILPYTLPIAKET